MILVRGIAWFVALFMKEAKSRSDATKSSEKTTVWFLISVMFTMTNGFVMATNYTYRSGRSEGGVGWAGWFIYGCALGAAICILIYKVREYKKRLAASERERAYEKKRADDSLEKMAFMNFKEPSAQESSGPIIAKYTINKVINKLDDPERRFIDWTNKTEKTGTGWDWLEWLKPGSPLRPKTKDDAARLLKEVNNLPGSVWDEVRGILLNLT